MTASTEGTDLGSWFENRSAYRRQARDTVQKLEECHRQLVEAVGNRRSNSAETFSDTTVSGIAALTQETVTGLQAAEAELSQIPAARLDAEAELKAVNDQIVRAIKQRSFKKSEQAAENKYAARKRQVWIKGQVMKFASIGVLLATLFVLYKY